MPAPESDAAAEPPMPAAPQTAVSQTAAPQTAASEPASAPARAPEAAVSRSAFVQLAAFRSADQVAPNWAAIQRKFPDLLAGLSATTRQVDLGNRGVFYRLLAGPLPDAAAARRLCGELRARDQDCLLRLN
jgi:cell division septation protein DedD